MIGTYEEFIYKRTYARWIEKFKRRESWDETVDRYKDFFLPKVPKDSTEEFFNVIENIRDRENMPSMRSFYTAGKALERDNIAGYNCCAIAINTLKSFAELLYILMNGSGVGFSIERQVINNLPEIPNNFNDVETNIVFTDSKKGWAEGYYSFIRCLFNGEIPIYDLSKIRPKGAILKTFGGRASGPEPLDLLLQKTCNVIKRAAGRKLNSLECHDICCFIAEAVVVGGVRRSSGISISNLSDERMRNAKSGEFWLAKPQRQLANNSVAYTEKPDIPTFMSEWRSLIKSGVGERGIINRVSLNKTVEKTERRKSGYDWLLNPCFTGDMRLLTVDGYQDFKSLENSEPYIINNQDNISRSKVWCSGEKKTIKLKLSDKSFITNTPDHLFMLNDGKEIEAKDTLKKRLYPYISLKGVDTVDKNSFIAGFILGDGNLTDLNNPTKKGLTINLSKKDGDVAQYIGIDYQEGKKDYYERRFANIARYFCLPKERTFNRYIPYDDLPYDSCIESFLRGLFSANGTVVNTDKAFRVSYKTSSFKMAESLQEILANSFLISSYITTNKAKKVKFKNGEYQCKKSYDVNIAKWSGIKKFTEYISFQQIYKVEKLLSGLQKHAPMVISIKDNGMQKVYDFTEPETHWGVVEGFVVHNCGEIILRPNEFCNLSEVIIKSYDTRTTLLKKVRNAVILGCLQSTLTNFKFVGYEFKKNCEEERLLGVSLTGLRDNSLLNNVSESSKKLLGEMKQEAIDCAKEWAEKLGISMPAAITCVKPSGTVSQLVNSSSGLHTRFSPYYIRRVRVTASDPMCKFLIQKGVIHTVETGQTLINPDTYVFDFPIKSPTNSVFNKDVSALDQLEYWRMLKEFWCEHNPSATIFVREDEWLDVGAWVFKYWDVIGGLSFLPKDTNIYPLAPYEAIREEEYLTLIKQFPEINFKDLDDFEDKDNTIGAKEFACSGGSCELI